MGIQNLAEVEAVYEIARCDYNIRIAVMLDVLHVEHIVGNVVVVYRAGEVLFTIEDAELSALGVDVVICSVSEMFNQVARFFLAVYLNIVDAGICHVTENEVNNTIAAHKCDSRYRTVIAKSVDLRDIIFKTNNSQCVHLCVLLLLHEFLRNQFNVFTVCGTD